jgi:hypothetical protein
MTTKSNTSRRKFLAALGAGGAAAAAVAVTQGNREPAPTAADATPQGRGYQVTEHVQKYYRTAKV